MNDVLESSATDVLEYEVEVLLFGEHDTHELDNIRMIEVSKNLGFFEKTLVACVQLCVVD